MGDDLAIANSARVSLHKHSDELTEADCGLIRYLVRQRHGTPFEQVVFSFRVRVPIGVAREWLRHRIASPNEESSRYVKLRPDFYVPEISDVRTQTGKPGHYTFVTVDPKLAQEFIDDLARQYAASYEFYEHWLKQGIARELVRNALPLGILTEFVWTINLRSLTNFLSLRTDPTALLEIRREAEEIETLIADIVPVAHAAWVENGRLPL